VGGTQTHREQGDLISLITLKILLGIQRQMDRHRQIHRQTARIFHKPPFIFQNKESRIKITQPYKITNALHREEEKRNIM
jgi:hypothetical protein